MMRDLQLRAIVDQINELLAECFSAGDLSLFKKELGGILEREVPSDEELLHKISTLSRDLQVKRRENRKMYTALLLVSNWLRGDGDKNTMANEVMEALAKMGNDDGK